MTAANVMTGHGIRREGVPSEGSCRVKCYMEPNCISINIGPLKGGKLECDLNNATAENKFVFYLKPKMPMLIWPSRQVAFIFATNNLYFS